MSALPIVAAAVEAVGLAVMARGASFESAGGLGDARRLARLGGYVALAGSVAFAAAAPIAPACVAIGGGAIALLGGLAGKPRPSWWVAAAVMASAGALALR